MSRQLDPSKVPAYPHRVFVRRRDGRSTQRLAVMALPVAVAVLFAGLGAVLENEAPGAQEPIPHEVFCCVPRAFDTASADPRASSIASAFRVVYTRTESRAVQVDRVLQAIGSDELGQAERRHLGGVLAGLSDHYGYDPALIVAVIMTESSFDPSSRSHKGALGLMQLLPNTAEQLAQETNRPWSGERGLFDPTYNISLGVRYLAQLQKRFGSLEVALAAYNYGPYRIEEYIRHGKQVPMDYTKRVLARYEEVRTAERLARL
jgi:soluble lytic murein transglycosylase-like protein